MVRSRCVSVEQRWRRKVAHDADHLAAQG
jgi:hypothetical protein